MTANAALLIAALILDALLGEPRWLWSRVPHPAVVMGRVIGWCDRRFNTGALPRLSGALCIAGLVMLGWLAGTAIAALPFGGLWSALGAAVLLAQRSLVQHLGAVADGLRYGLPAGRRAVAMIVGRDTATMEAPDIARAAIESGAENLSDGVIAPAFWFLLLGLPGIVIYKLVNTADSMIGHRTPRHEAFGWAAARLDDLLNWVPARVTAGMIALAHLDLRAAKVARRDARLHRSPNAGWPEAAMAAVLDVSLSGPRSYHGVRQDLPLVHPEGRITPGIPEIEAAIRALWRSWGVMLALLAALALL